MIITMAELNKNVNAIINQAEVSVETVTLLKHVKPIATITPIEDQDSVQNALDFLATLKPIAVQKPINSVLEQGSMRGF